jgi:hypothetical protein
MIGCVVQTATNEFAVVLWAKFTAVAAIDIAFLA